MPRLSFSLRDVFWLTLVVGLALGWWLDRTAIDTKRQRASEESNLYSAWWDSASDWQQGAEKAAKARGLRFVTVVWPGLSSKYSVELVDASE